jgi:quercetin dioxygenase-like cupin family protein
MYSKSVKHLIVGMALLATAELHAVELTIPTEKSGATPRKLESIELGDLKAANEKSLRMREATLAPGGALPLHPHHDRPAVVYILKGELTVYSDIDQKWHTYRPGEHYKIYQSSHALRNLGQEAAVFIEVDLF